MHTRTAVIIDIVLVVVFALIGRASHSESLTPAGVFQTAWPFLAALVIGWVMMLVRKRPGLNIGAGIFLWIVTVVGGMVFRVGSGDTAATAFIIVATITLGLFLVGWRAIIGRRLDEVRPWQSTDVRTDQPDYDRAASKGPLPKSSFDR